MKISRRSLLKFATLSSMAGATQAQTVFPRGPVRLIVPFPPGGPVDVTARALAQRLTELWSQQVAVENRSGGNSVIGAEAAARAAPDGHTIFVGAIHQSVLPGFGNKLPYDLEKDFTPVMFGAQFPIILCAHPSVPAANVRELIKYARANPRRLAYSSAGKKRRHPSGGRIVQRKGRRLHAAHSVSRQCAGDDRPVGRPGATDVLRRAHRAAASEERPRQGAGGRHPRRSALVPELPTMIEAGLPGYQAYSWAGIWVPR